MDDASRGSYESGHGQGVGEGNQFLMVWSLRPEGEGPPVKVKMFSVDAREVVKNQPRLFRYAFPGDPTPERAPYTPEERAALTAEGKIEKLRAEKAEAQRAMEIISTRIDQEIQLLKDGADR